MFCTTCSAIWYYVCNTSATAGSTRAGNWAERVKNIQTNTETETWVTLDTRVPNLLCSGEAYVGLWPCPSSQNLLAAACQPAQSRGKQVVLLRAAASIGNQAAHREFEVRGSTAPNSFQHNVTYTNNLRIRRTA